MGQLELKFGSEERNFEIKMNGIEGAIQLKILELCMNGIKDEVTEEKNESEEKDFTPKDLKSGYQLFNKPVLETKEEPKINRSIIVDEEPKEKIIHKFDKEKSTREISGVKHYQLFYICPSCGKKGKHYILPGTEVIECHDTKTCKETMMVRQATYKGFPFHDEWGNYYIAGEFKRSLKDKEDEDLYYKTH